MLACLPAAMPVFHLNWCEVLEEPAVRQHVTKGGGNLFEVIIQYLAGLRNGFACMD